MRLVAALPVAMLLTSIAFPPEPRLVWNVSASAPTGLYRVRSGEAPRVGEVVVARVPEYWRSLAAARHYIPINVPLVKRVAAADGDVICSSGRHIFINGNEAAVRLSRDAHGRPLPEWQGCRRLGQGEYFLLMDGKASFDGRYFGVTDEADVIGPARLIWPG